MSKNVLCKGGIKRYQVKIELAHALLLTLILVILGTIRRSFSYQKATPPDSVERAQEELTFNQG